MTPEPHRSLAPLFAKISRYTYECFSSFFSACRLLENILHFPKDFQQTIAPRLDPFVDAILPAQAVNIDLQA